MSQQQIQDQEEDQLQVQPDRSREPFRLACKSIHLTYKTFLPLEELRVFISDKVGPLVWWTLVHETGSPQSETPYDHTHVAFEALQKIQTRNPRLFDYESIHPNIKRIESKAHAKRIWTYHTKDPIMSLRSDLGPDGLAPQPLLTSALQASTLREACSMLGVGIKTVSDVRTLRMDRAVNRDIPPLASPRPFSIPLELSLASQNLKVLYVFGTSGTGKTRWAISQFISPLLVSHMEDLKSFWPDMHDGLIFDDMDFTNLSGSQSIHLLDWDFPRTLNVKHGSVTIPAHTRRIFTSNLSFQEAFPNAGSIAQYEAILRRVSIVKIAAPLYTSSSIVTMNMLASPDTNQTVPATQSPMTLDTDPLLSQWTSDIVDDNFDHCRYAPTFRPPDSVHDVSINYPNGQPVYSDKGERDILSEFDFYRDV